MSDPFVDPEEQAEESAAPRPMLPLDRRRLRTGHPPQAIPMSDDTLDDEAEPDEQPVAAPRSTRQDLDPVLGYILVMAFSVGLTPLHPNLRYIVLWSCLAVMGGMAYLLGSGIQFRVDDPVDLLVGLGLGLLAGGALMMVGVDILATTSERLFNDGRPNDAMLDTWVFQAVVFVMPLSETLFFRGAMQRVHPIPVVTLLATAWAMLMFFPNLELGDTPMVGVVIGSALVLVNFLYSYVQERNGLAASFLCQITASALLLLAPRLVSF
ncbi:MAG: hypothetical protein GYB65_16245 [Chloroflexi bacterium]|nr:hypothetical protein [Chloroflexota bacterium]